MKKIILAYLIPYFTAVAAAFVGWMLLIWFTEDSGPELGALAFLAVLLFTLPYLIYEDYKRIRTFVNNAHAAYKDESKRGDFYQDTTIAAASHFGLPEFVAEWGVKRAMGKIKELRA